MPSHNAEKDGKSACGLPACGIFLQAADRIRMVRTANSQKTGRQPKASASAPLRRSGPTTTPNDPANVQRAIFCSWRAGAESIKLACERLTNAPEDGLNRMN